MLSYINISFTSHVSGFHVVADLCIQGHADVH